MAFHFTPGNFQLNDKLPSLQYELAQTGQDLYNHVMNLMGCQVQIKIMGQDGNFVSIDPAWNLKDCFMQADYELSVFIDGTNTQEFGNSIGNQDQGQAPQNILTYVYVNGTEAGPIQIPIESSLLNIVQTYPLQGLVLQQYELYDINSNLLIQGTDAPMVSFSQYQQLILNITAQPGPQPPQEAQYAQQQQAQAFGVMNQQPDSSQQPDQQQQDILVNFFVNNAPALQLTAHSQSFISEIIQQSGQVTEFSQLQSYALYDSFGSLLVQDTDVQLIQYLQSEKPFTLNISTTQIQQNQQSGNVKNQHPYGGSNPIQPPQYQQSVTVLTYLNSLQSNQKDYPADTSLSQIVNQVLSQIQGQTMLSYTLYDASNQQLVENKDISLSTFMQAQQPFILNVTTSPQIANPNKFSGSNNVQNFQQAPQNATSNVITKMNQPFVPPGFSAQPQVPQGFGAQQQQKIAPSTPIVQPPQQPVIAQPPQQPEPQKLSVVARAKLAMQELRVLKKFSLLVDSEGEFVIFKFHLPVMVTGSLRKEISTPKPSFKKDKHEWVSVNNVKIAETQDYGFAIQWDNGNISKVKLNLM